MKSIMGIGKRKFISFLLLLCVLASLRLDQPAQIKPVYDQGTLGLVRLLKRLNTSASAMMIGAHPDDEDTALLAYLARGENARTAYLSLTRGDGGQNIMGPELGEALGVIRTEELLQARKLDGAEQYFTRAYDYGFSKTLAEARQKWDENVIICDAVRAIRHFRPLVVVSQFAGTPADGHGQHQFSGYIAPLAVKAAGDPGQCADAGPAWAVKRFYVRHRGQGEPRLRINTGQFNRMLGRSYFEIAMEARSQHRSQEQGVLELKGEAFSALNNADAGAGEKGIFDQIEVSVKGVAANTGESSPRFVDLAERMAKAAARALDEFDVQDPTKIIPLLLEGYGAAYEAGWILRSPAAKAFMEQKQSEFLAAMRYAAGLQIDAISDRETVVPGETANVAVRVFHPADGSVAVKSAKLIVPGGWNVVAVEPPPTPEGGGALARREVPNFGSNYSVTLPAEAAPTQPYWLKELRAGDMFNWTAGMPRNVPFQEPEIAAEVTVIAAGKELRFTQPVEYRFADDVRGEIRRPLAVVPRVSVSLEEELVIVPRAKKVQEREMSATVTNNSSGPVSGSLVLKAPTGATVRLEKQGFTLSRRGESVSVPFTIAYPAIIAAGNYELTAAANVGGAVFTRSMRVIAYPHIQTHRLYADAAAKVRVFDLETAPVKVGFIAGSGDRVPQAIAQMGLDIETIDERTLASGDLSKFNAIVVGIRAYQVRTDIVAHNKRLLDFANAGGTLIVQYQLPGYTQQGLAPYPAQQGPRVSDELAKVTIVDPRHPIFNFPNKISDADFSGWVQERNLYNFSTMDAKYTGLLEAHDPTEPENKGGLVVADVGKGKFIYCSYSLFRQLPAGVPGAYRLLANMVAYSGDRARVPAR